MEVLRVGSLWSPRVASCPGCQDELGRVTAGRDGHKVKCWCGVQSCLASEVVLCWGLCCSSACLALCIRDMNLMSNQQASHTYTVVSFWFPLLELTLGFCL